ncbi:hypothetical protein ABZ733_08235 [Streptomyces longwoodensis]|uniref:hypothetical protein n=1 Tax=Streptomyces longwoodensis TaxID=68231 RepID=UPI00340B3483
MPSRVTVIDQLLRRPAPVREPLACELRGSVVQLLGPGTTVPSWQATPAVLAEAIDTALQKQLREEKDTQAPGRTGESTARGGLFTALQDGGAVGGPAGSLTGGHALVVEQGAGEFVGSCQCGRRLGRLTPSGSVDGLAGLWELHLTQLPDGGER